MHRGDGVVGFVSTCGAGLRKVRYCGYRVMVLMVAPVITDWMRLFSISLDLCLF